MTGGILKPFATLSVLVEGYLHQDFVADHGTAAAAVRTALAEVGPATALEVSSEWRTFLNLTYGLDAQMRAARLRQVVGGAWSPGTAAEFDEVSAVLLSAGLDGGR